MMKAAGRALLPLPLLVAGSAFAQPVIEGVSLRSVELCEKARTNGIESVLEEGELMLTASGLQGYEFHCEFLVSTAATLTPASVVTALCEEPGYAYPELFAVTQRSEGVLELTVPQVGDNEEGSPITGEYHLCEGVPLP